ncbi:hypothetical protein SEVIR_8G068700v4 [Setaria viridis]|uniref:Uncharacterized protein n=3 Tax=Setaria TaxID=4554 RepID=A0A368S574_SETIT|nr:uncharacterized protein LOC101780233 [Setaria italica]XP_034568397.1 uncharacterized protein LOC117833113 [Setaria viridis]RCV37494.1 hypothetical protein SETIT_8G067500v2 [Setaria italica]TKV99819.1 hypothetical protein SEVIR_8G068700v2 [Setaria viridis]
MHGQLSMRMRCLRPSGRRRCPLLGGDTAAFCASLVEGMAHLESTLEVDNGVGGGAGVGSGSVSMRWCADAMRLVKRMQREMLAIFRKADVPAAAAGGGGWFEHYMQETAALLDFLNAFKAAVSRMHRYCIVVDFAAQVGRAAGGDGGGAAAAASLVVESAAATPRTAEEPGQAASSAAAAVRDKIADAKAAVAEAERLERTIISAGAGGDAGGMVIVTLVAKITTSVLSMFVLQALTSPSSLDAGGVQPALASSAVDVPELEPWRESLSLIHDRFPSRATVAEHEKVATVVRDLVNGKDDGGGRHGSHQQDELARGHVELLRARSGELREEVEMFDCVLDEVFDEVIRGRNEMLGILRDKALT